MDPYASVDHNGMICLEGKCLKIGLRDDKCIWTTTLPKDNDIERKFLRAIKNDNEIQCICGDCWDPVKNYPKDFEYDIGDKTGVYLRGWVVTREYLNDAYDTMSKTSHDDFDHQNSFLVEKFLKTHFFTLWRNLHKDPGVFCTFICEYDANQSS